MLSNRLAKHFAAAAAVTVVAGAANAAVVYSGIINFACAVDIDGCYINVETGVLSNGPASGVPGWDVNPYSSGGGMNFFTGSTGGGQLRQPGEITGPAGNLALGTIVGSIGSFNTSTGNVYGNAAAGWQYSAENYIGFRFVSAAGTTHYGWMRFAMGAPGSAGTAMTRTVVDYAWESDAGTSIAVGAGIIPAPGAIALLGLAGLAGRRRR